MLTCIAAFVNKLGQLQPGQGVQLSHHEMGRMFQTEMPNDEAVKEAEALARDNDCTFFYEEREHDRRVVFRKSLRV